MGHSLPSVCKAEIQRVTKPLLRITSGLSEEGSHVRYDPLGTVRDIAQEGSQPRGRESLQDSVGPGSIAFRGCHVDVPLPLYFPTTHLPVPSSKHRCFTAFVHSHGLQELACSMRKALIKLARVPSH